MILLSFCISVTRFLFTFYNAYIIYLQFFRFCIIFNIESMSHNENDSTISVGMEDDNVLLKEDINFTSQHKSSTIGTSKTDEVDIDHGTIAPNPASPIINSNAKIKVGQTYLQTALLEVSSGLFSLSSIFASALEKVNSLKDIVDNSLLCDIDVPSNFASSSSDVSATNVTTPATFSQSTTVPTTSSSSVYTSVSKATSVSTSISLPSQPVYYKSASAGVSQVSPSAPLRSSSWGASSSSNATVVSTQSALPSVVNLASSTASNTSAPSHSNSGTAGTISPASTIVVQTTASRITPIISSALVSKPPTPTRTVPNVTITSTLVSRSSTNTTLPRSTQPGLLSATAVVTSTQSTMPSPSIPFISTQAKGNLYAYKG